MAVHSTILARQRRLRGGANAVCNDTSWSSANHNSTIHNRANHNSTIHNRANRNSASHTSAIHNRAIRVNTNATWVIPPPPAFSWRPLRCRCRCNLD
jgi:hypothetical protein